jgi:hypothetical protein
MRASGAKGLPFLDADGRQQAEELGIEGIDRLLLDDLWTSFVEVRSLAWTVLKDRPDRLTNSVGGGSSRCASG